MSRMELKAATDRQTVCVELHMDGAPLGHIILGPAETEGFIQTLSGLRELLFEAVPTELEPMARVTATIDPIWEVAPMETPPGQPRRAMLTLRHPGIGWLNFALPAKEAEKMGKELIGIAQKPSEE